MIIVEQTKDGIRHREATIEQAAAEGHYLAKRELAKQKLATATTISDLKAVIEALL